MINRLLDLSSILRCKLNEIEENYGVQSSRWECWSLLRNGEHYYCCLNVCFRVRRFLVGYLLYHFYIHNFFKRYSDVTAMGLFIRIWKPKRPLRDDSGDVGPVWLDSLPWSDTLWSYRARFCLPRKLLHLHWNEFTKNT